MIRPPGPMGTTWPPAFDDDAGLGLRDPLRRPGIDAECPASRIPRYAGCNLQGALQRDALSTRKKKNRSVPVHYGSLLITLFCFVWNCEWSERHQRSTDTRPQESPAGVRETPRQADGDGDARLNPRHLYRLLLQSH